MAIVNTEQSLLPLRIALLRIRLLAIRSLLGWVIGLRSFIRRRRQPAQILVDPRVRIPIGLRKGRLMTILIVSAACAATGFMAGRQNGSTSADADLPSRMSELVSGCLGSTAP
jgi:hypothetical protein